MELNLKKQRGWCLPVPEWGYQLITLKLFVYSIEISHFKKNLHVNYVHVRFEHFQSTFDYILLSEFLWKNLLVCVEKISGYLK